jgi:cellulose synthase/poly-beta-1,6-N-acetylglucosamine synthase-like glycosyltransferase
VRLARGELIAFLGDDTVPARDWLRQHWRAHQSATAVAAREPGSWVGVIGYTAWHRRMRLNPFLRYINEYGLQFGFALIQDPDDVPFNFFYTSNLSLPREALLAEPFDLAFPYAAWEDIEASYRLKKRGLRLLYAPEAQVQHDHPTHLRRFCERQEKAGYCAVVFYHRHPELAGFLGLGPQGPPPLPSAYRQKVRELLARGLQQLPVSCPRLWEETLRYHYIAGLHRGWREGAGAKGQSPESAGETPCPQSTVLEKVGRG